MDVRIDSDNSEAPYISWSPLHFAFIMKRVGWITGAKKWERTVVDSKMLRIARAHLAELCGRPMYSGRYSSIKWRQGFLAVILMRCLAQLPDNYFLPSYWFESEPIVRCNHFKADISEISTECKLAWSEVEELIKTDAGLGPGIGMDPVILVYLSGFEDHDLYDVLALYCDKGEIVDSCGYQLKRERNKEPLVPLFSAKAIKRSFIIRGNASAANSVERGWNVAGSDHITHFYGRSGRDWMPTRSFRFRDSFDEYWRERRMKDSYE